MQENDGQKNIQQNSDLNQKLLTQAISTMKALEEKVDKINNTISHS